MKCCCANLVSSEHASTVDLAKECQQVKGDKDLEFEQENSSGLSWGSRKRRSKKRKGKKKSTQVCARLLELIVS